MDRNWLRVLAAAFVEVIWVIGLAHAHDVWTWAGTVVAIVVSNYLMITAGQVLPAGTVYAVFVGLGTAGTVVSEIIFFNEPLQWEKILLIGLILAGVMGLKLVTDHKRAEGGKS